MTFDKPSGEPSISRLIDRLKLLYKVKEDQELAIVLGASKSAVANWRRRARLPKSVIVQVSKDFPGEQLALTQGDDALRIKLNEDVYAAALFIVDDSPPPIWQGEPQGSLQNLRLRAFIFSDVVDALRRHIISNLLELDVGDALIQRCIRDYQEDRIEGMAKALMKGLRGEG